MAAAYEHVAAAAAVLLLVSVCSALARLLLQSQRPKGASAKRPRENELEARESREAQETRDAELWLARLQVSVEEAAQIRSFPQRRRNGHASTEWLRHRRHRLTASRFSKAAAAVSGEGGDAELTARQLIEDMLVQPEAHTSPQRFGIANEDRARQSYAGFRSSMNKKKSFSVEETGLCVSIEEPWLAASPDGVVWEGDAVGALEIKCAPDASRLPNVNRIPEQYYDQMQGEMAILSSTLQRPVTWCDFFVWSPVSRKCKRVNFDHEYFHGRLLPKLRAFYFGQYMPIARQVPLGASGSSLQKCARKMISARQKKDKKQGKVA